MDEIPTKERMGKGDIADYEAKGGGLRFQRSPGLEYHTWLYLPIHGETKASLLSADAHRACENLMWLYFHVAGRNKTVLGSMQPTSGGIKLAEQEVKQDASWRYRKLMSELTPSHQNLLAFLLFHDSTLRQAAKASRIRSESVQAEFIAAANELAEAWRKMLEA